MKCRSLIICDEEKEYALKLASFLNGRKGVYFQIKVCSVPEKLLESQREMDYLLISDQVPYHVRKKIQAKITIVLSSERVGEKESYEHYIYKYQAAEALYSELLKIIAEQTKDRMLPIRKGEKKKIIGFHSPVHRTGQTATALRMGKKLSQKKNVLYLNLESYAGLNYYFPEDEKNLSTLLYYSKQEAGNLGMLLPSIVRKMDLLDYVAPIFFPDELLAVQGKEWVYLLRSIMETSIYDVLILDIGVCIQGIFDVLELCDTIYIPKADDQISISKMEQLKQALYRSGYANVWEKVMIYDEGRGTLSANSWGYGSDTRD